MDMGGCGRTPASVGGATAFFDFSIFLNGTMAGRVQETGMNVPGEGTTGAG
jgi:hypothetical protein